MTTLVNVPFLRTGKDFAFVVGTVAALYIAWQIRSGVIDLVNFDAGKFWRGLTFSADDLGPTVEDLATQEYHDSRAFYIREGYLEVLPDGSTKITPLGEAYITANKGNLK